MIQQYRFLTFLTMLYMTVKLTTVVLIYKIIKIGPFSASSSTLIMPLWFVMGDIIAEVYGYKIVLRGRHFWLRSLAASAVGEFVFTMIAYLTEFLGVTPWHTLLHLMTVSYLIKLALNPVLVVPSTFLALALKKSEGIDAYDTDTNFNPFSFSLVDSPVLHYSTRAKAANNAQFNEV